ncbi:sodium/glucose cotransporter [Plakobranchus ocellatus]|uniref:Sodium/glucose cotransporter n=1 Tax=Plakobranchus ocellatus TaxID=259542 RepID=A0AAV3ZF23_9GAST|nr:sodium/glucose cotransporter [Plakobranchus ocellatus]
MAATDEDSRLHYGDWIVIAGYFVAVIAVGILSSCRNRGSVGGYFLAGRSMHWIPVGASLFASNIGSGHFVGLAGSGAASGIGIAVFELNAIFILMILGWFFVPVYIAAGVFTMPEYLRKRFGGQRIRIYLSVLALILYVFTKISADLYSGAIFLTQAVPDLNLYGAIIILLAVAALFTIGGGLTAVIWTDFIQTVIMVVGAFILMIMGFIEVGGYNELEHRFFSAYPNTTIAHLGKNDNYSYTDCGIPTDKSYHLVRPADDDDLPWPGVFIGLTISSVWYWCSDQVIVQRALAAKNLSHAKAGCILAGYLKFLPMWLIVFPGMIARVLYPDDVACGDPAICQEVCDQDSCTNIAFPTLVLRLMPDGLRGLMLAVMMSALISSLTSIFNSSSTIFTMDIWRRIRTSATEVELMIVGRLCVVILVGVGVIWIPVVQSVTELFHYIQAITSFLAPPICAVYVLAVFWKRTNETGSFYGLMVGLVVGIIRFAWEYSYERYPCGEDYKSDKPDIISKVHYLHFGILLYGIVTIVTIVVSLLTPPIDDVHLQRLTYWNRFSTLKRVDLSEADASADTAEPMETPKPFQDDYDSLPWYRKACEWICGIEKMRGEEHKMTDAEMRALEEKQTSIHEQTFWRRFLNFNAVFLMTLAAFVWGFFA